MTDNLVTLKFGIQSIESKRRDIEQIVALIASLVKPAELGTEGVNLNSRIRSRHFWWTICVGNARNRILIQCGEGGLTMFDSWANASAQYVEDVWEALDILVDDVQRKIPGMSGRMEPFFQAGRNAVHELLRANSR